MPEKDNKPMTIRFAGREIDAHDFVDLAKEKAVQWMDYQQLQGDERTDFINSFNEILQGIVDNKYEISEFGKIMGLPEEPNYYTESNGTKKDGEGKWYNRRRVGFNPHGNVETYLNGIAKLAKEYKAPDTSSSKKAWKKGMLGTLLGNAVFGEGNNQSLVQNPGLLEAWANQYDPFKNGVRTTSGRRLFIIDNVLDPYEKALNAGEYNIDDTTLQSELTNIANLRKYINSDFELGKIFPLASHYLFTGEKYMTDELKAAAQLKAKRDAFTSGLAEYSEDLGYTPEQLTAANLLRESNIKKNRDNAFKSYDLLGTYSKPYTYTLYKTANLGESDISLILNTPLRNVLKSSNKYQYNYFKYVNAYEINGVKYLPNWQSGDLFIISKDSDDNLILSIRDIQSAIRTSETLNPDLYNYLRESWDAYNGYESYKKGGIIKALPGTKMPGVGPEEENTTLTTQTPLTPKTNTQIGINPYNIQKTLNLRANPNSNNNPVIVDLLDPYNIQKTLNLKLDTEINPSLKDDLGFFGEPAPKSAFELGEYKVPEVELPYFPKTKKLNTAVRGDYNTYRPAKSWNTKSTSDWMLDALGIGKGAYLGFANLRILDNMTSLQAVHKDTIRKEATIISPKTLLDDIALTKAEYNQLGATYAAGTSNMLGAFAAQLAAHKAANDKTDALEKQVSTMTLDLKDKVLENENNNFAKLNEVGEANYSADTALYNYNKQQLAEYYSRWGKQHVAQLSEQQKGIAESTQKNFEREKQYAVYNDPEYQTLEKESQKYYERILQINEELTTNPANNEELTNEKNRLTQQMRLCEYRKAILQKKILDKYDAENVTPYGFTWGLPGTVYQQVPPDPLESRKNGGKMELAEKEKTKRMYAKMLFDMMKMDMNHMYKQNRDAYKDYRKIFMQQSK